MAQWASAAGADAASCEQTSYLFFFDSLFSLTLTDRVGHLHSLRGCRSLRGAVRGAARRQLPQRLDSGRLRLAVRDQTAHSDANGVHVAGVREHVRVALVGVRGLGRHIVGRRGVHGARFAVRDQTAHSGSAANQ